MNTMELNRRNVVRRLKPSKGLFTLIFTSLTMLVSLAASADVYIEPEEFVVFYHHDVLGSPVTATNEKGQVLWHERNSSYGKSEGRISQNANPFGDNAVPAADSRQGYTGHTLDNSVGLTYMKARYYDHNLGRFLSNDPVGYTFRNPIQSFNRYAYANNNPYIYTDPDGEAAAVVFIGASALFLGALVVAYNNAVNGPSPELISGFSNWLNSDKTEDEEDWEEDYEEWVAGNSDGTTKHGEKRKSERQVDDEKVREGGEKFWDHENGTTVYVDGNNVVVDGEDGNVTRWNDQTEAETSSKVESGAWEPID